MAPVPHQHIDDIISSMKQEGYSQNEIAKANEVSRQYISKRVRANPDIYRTVRDRVRDSWPIDNREFVQSNKERRLRDHLEYMISLGEGMEPGKLDLLNRFYHYLINNNFVVEFDPTIKPIEDSVGGYEYRARKTKDHDLVLRQNQYVKFNEQSEILWTLPPVLPDGTKR